MDLETIYSSAHRPDPGSALDVLAFVLAPVAAFATTGDAKELEEVSAFLGGAKAEAVSRWLAIRATAQLG